MENDDSCSPVRCIHKNRPFGLFTTFKNLCYGKYRKMSAQNSDAAPGQAAILKCDYFLSFFSSFQLQISANLNLKMKGVSS